MTGPEHFKQAERCLSSLEGKGHQAIDVILAKAQVHATLALADAMAMLVDQAERRSAR